LAEREVSWEQLVQAGTVLFGPGFAAAIHAPGWRLELRAAWRRRVLETHPDRAAVLGRSEAELQREFRAVSEAFALLESHAGAAGVSGASDVASVAPATQRARSGPATTPSPPRGPFRPPPTGGPTRPSPPPRAAGPRRPTEPPRTPPRPPRPPPPPTAQTAEGSGPRLPRRRLRLAEYLYYSGRVGWQDYVAAVAWQRGQRPAIGRLAVELGLLGQRDVADLLERRRRDGAQSEPFGEFAVRRGFLTRNQLLAVVGRQKQGERRIGQYFMERGLLNALELDAARLALFGHNARYATLVA
jgi:hypothetical protein